VNAIFEGGGGSEKFRRARKRGSHRQSIGGKGVQVPLYTLPTNKVGKGDSPAFCQDLKKRTRPRWNRLILPKKKGKAVRIDSNKNCAPKR